MIKITITIAGVEVAERLEGIEERIGDLRPVWPLVLKAAQGAIARAFASEGATTGAKWPELKPRTQRDRARQGFPPAHPILQRTTKLMRALVLGEGLSDEQSMRYVVSEQEVPYFKYHQRGGPGLPRRAPVQFTPEDRAAIVLPIRLYIRSPQSAGA